MSRVLLSSWAPATSVNLNQKSATQRSYLRVTRSEGSERLGRLLTTWAVRGSHMRRAHYLLVTLQAAVQDMCLHAGASVNLMPLQATWPHKVGAQAAIPWSGLVKLLTQCKTTDINMVHNITAQTDHFQVKAKSDRLPTCSKFPTRFWCPFFKDK